METFRPQKAEVGQRMEVATKLVAKDSCRGSEGRAGFTVIAMLPVCLQGLGSKRVSCFLGRRIDIMPTL